MIAADILTFEEAIAAVDHSTLVLLFGMMIVVANLRLSGVFRLVASWTVRHAHRPLTLLAAIIVVAGVFSAFFVNDTMCLVLTPLVLEITTALRRNPIPYLLAVAMASNAGSVATITGNPQNMMIGAMSGIPYRQFTFALAPVAAISLLLTFLVLALIYRREFAHAPRVDIDPAPPRVNRVLMLKSVSASAAMIALFFYGWPVAKVAIVTGAILLITRRVKPEKVYRDIDWSLLATFTGLFIVVAGFHKSGFDLPHYALDRIPVLTAVSAVVSNLVSNVPAVLLFRSVVTQLSDPVQGWLTLAMSSTLAGNLTLLGSMANIIVVERARAEVRITFMEYLRAGVPLTILSLAAGALWLLMRASG